MTQNMFSIYVYLVAEISASLDAVTREGCIRTESNIGLIV